MKKQEALVFAGLLVFGFISFFFDSYVTKFFSGFLNPFFVYAIALFKPIEFYIVFAILIIFILAIKHKKQEIIYFVFTVIFTLIASFIIKFIVMRPRPLGFIEYLPFTNIIDYSFPSSHTAIIFSMLPLLDKELKHYRYFWIALVILIGLSRLYFNAHYLSDIIFGALLGYAIGYFILKTNMRLFKNLRVLWP